MSVEGTGTPLGASPARNPQAELRRLCHELEAVFLRQLFSAMRSSVPADDQFAPSQGEEIFTGLLDDRLASDAAEKLDRGVGEVLYRQLSRRLPPEEESCQATRE
jgi:Rod binding domain-containing protein